MVCVSHKVDDGDRNRKRSSAANASSPCAAGQGNWTRFGVSVPVTRLCGRDEENTLSPASVVQTVLLPFSLFNARTYVTSYIVWARCTGAKTTAEILKRRSIGWLHEILVYRFFTGKNKRQNGIDGTSGLQAGHKQGHHLGGWSGCRVCSRTLTFKIVPISLHHNYRTAK